MTSDVLNRVTGKKLVIFKGGGGRGETEFIRRGELVGPKPTLEFIRHLNLSTFFQQRKRRILTGTWRMLGLIWHLNLFGLARLHYRLVADWGERHSKAGRSVCRNWTWGRGRRVWDAFIPSFITCRRLWWCTRKLRCGGVRAISV